MGKTGFENCLLTFELLFDSLLKSYVMFESESKGFP